jgi:Amt family ammonium transporter
VYTHGIAGLLGGLMAGLFADPGMVVYLGLGRRADVTTSGLFYGHPKQLAIQAGAALTVIAWDALVTFLLLRGIGLVMKLRIPDADLEVGDVAVHGEEVCPPGEPVRAGTRDAAAAPPPAGLPDGRPREPEKVPSAE